METGNKFAVFLIVILSCHLLPTHARKTKHISLNLPGGQIPGGQIPNPEVKKACDSTDNPLLCLSSVGPFLQGKFDSISILQGEIKAAEAQTKVVMQKAAEIAQNPTTAEDVKQGLTYCKENYDSTIGNLNAAIDAIVKHDKGSLTSSLSAVISDLSTCDDTFAETTTTPSPMKNLETPIKDLIINCLALLSFLRW